MPPPSNSIELICMNQHAVQMDASDELALLPNRLCKQGPDEVEQYEIVLTERIRKEII